MRVVSVNISESKGTVKQPAGKITLTGQGVEKDAHAGDWHRQVSLLGIESIRKFGQKLSRELHPGDFGENITTEGAELFKMSPLSYLANDEVRIQITQIGKKCHGKNCSIYRETGDCIMPVEGIFGRVVQGGVLKTGDGLEYLPKTIKALILTLSDRASRGEYEDLSGPLLRDRLQVEITKNGWELQADLQILPDDRERVQKLVARNSARYDLVFTTGSTGIGPRDIAPEALRPLLDREIPGIMEMIRVKYGMEKHNALLSRSLAGIIGRTLVYALPGSPKAIMEYTGEIFKTLKHSLLMLHSIDSH